MRLKTLWLLLASAALAGCGALASTPAPLPTVVLNKTTAPAGSAGSAQSVGGQVTASGVVVPPQQAQLALAAAGQVAAVTVTVGDEVKAGQVLIQLAGGDRSAAAVAAADLEVLNAQQALKDLQASAGMTTAQAQLAVANAQEALDKAQTALKNLAHPDVAYYRDQFNRAQANLAAVRQNATITNFQTSLRAAADALETATNDLKKYQSLEQQYPGYGQQHDNALEKAQKAYDRAQQDYQSAQFRFQQAQTNDANTLTDAQKAFDTAQGNLASAQAGPDPIKLAVAQANVAIAQAALDAAQTHYAQVKAGPDPDQLALAQARLASAQAQRAAVKSAQEDLELRAPFDGTIIEVRAHTGEWAVPGQPVLLLSDLRGLRVETTDLSERDVALLKVGQSARVLVKALNQTVAGKLSAIAPVATSLGGDVVYKTTVTLDAQPEGLRAGMSVQVDFSLGP